MNRRQWLASGGILTSGSLLSPPFTSLSRIVRSDDPVDSEIYLGANENPYGPSTNAINAMTSVLCRGNRYPSVHRDSLKNTIADNYILNPNQVALSAGSSEILQLLSILCVQENRKVVTGDDTFNMLPAVVSRLGGEVIKIPMTSGKGFDLETMARVALKHAGMVYLVNPNNPTGTKLHKSDILIFLEKLPSHCMVTVDEAYIEYVGEEESCIDLVSQFPNLIVVRTFSKLYGLAGMRIGYCVGNVDVINQIRNLQGWPGGSVSTAGLVAAAASLNDKDFTQKSRKENASVRAYSIQELRKIGLRVIDGHANFLYYRCGPTEEDVPSFFRKYKIHVGVSSYKDEIWMRVTMGTQSEMEVFIKAARELWV